jgi:hypothetical protein
MIRVVHPGSGILIFLPIPDPGQKGTRSRIRIRNTADAYVKNPKTGDHLQSFNLNPDPACRLGYLKIRKMWLGQQDRRFIGTYFGADPDPYSVNKWLLIFSSITSKMPTKNKVLFTQFVLLITLYKP